MTEEIQMIYDELTSSCEKTLIHLAGELQKVRAGKATPSMLNSVQVDYYGTMTALAQGANVSTMDARA